MLFNCTDNTHCWQHTEKESIQWVLFAHGKLDAARIDDRQTGRPILTDRLSYPHRQQLQVAAAVSSSVAGDKLSVSSEVVNAASTLPLRAYDSRAWTTDAVGGFRVWSSDAVGGSTAWTTDAGGGFTAWTTDAGGGSTAWSTDAGGGSTAWTTDAVGGSRAWSTDAGGGS